MNDFIEKEGMQCLLDFLKNMDYDTWCVFHLYFFNQICFPAVKFLMILIFVYNLVRVKFTLQS